MRRKAVVLGLLVVSVFVSFEVSAYAQQAAPRRDRDNNPPGMAGGAGTDWENKPGPQGGPGASPNRAPRRDRDDNPPGAVGGSGTNWENKPGPQGGPGASPDIAPPLPGGNNPLGITGAPGASSDIPLPPQAVNRPWERKADTNQDGVVDQTELQQAQEQRAKKAVVDQEWEKKADANQDGVVDETEMRHWKSRHNRGVDPSEQAVESGVNPGS